MSKDVIEQCASAFIATLTSEELAYCTDKERGEYMGFAALHDLMDANVELVDAIDALGLPLTQCPIELRGFSTSEEEIDFLNKVMDQINVQLKGESES
jgi:hypothetical protein